MKVGQSGRPEWFRRSGLKDKVEQMFLGQYFHSLDNKGRITVPMKYRELIANKVIITKGFDPNLLVMPPEVFENLASQVNEQNYADPNARLLRRFLFSNGETAEVDKAGRILIPQYLRQKANLNTDVVIVGVGDFFEIWSAENWTEHEALLDDAEANVARFIDYRLSTNSSGA
ncbi:MAG: division/cell wall cluster transcriptional repressor MraZ [Anaerolineales bacterium]